MGLYEDVLQYLRVSSQRDTRVNADAALLDLRNQQAYDELLSNPRFAEQFPPLVTQRYTAALSAHEALTANSALAASCSPQLVAYSVAQNTEALARAVHEFDTESYARTILRDTGYAVDEMDAAQETLTQDLAEWRAGKRTHVPIRERFDPLFLRSGVEDAAESQIETPDEVASAELVCNDEESTVEKGRVRRTLESLVAAGLGALAVLATPFSYVLHRGKNRSGKEDFSGELNDFNMLKPLSTLEKISQRTSTSKGIRVEGSAPIYVTHIITGMHDKTANFAQLQERGYVVNPLNIPKAQADLDSDKHIWLYTLTAKKLVADDKPVPLHYTRVFWNPSAVGFLPARWYLEDLPIRDFTPQEISPAVQEQLTAQTNVQGLEQTIKDYFRYATPAAKNKDATRFENAIATKTGVCQDANLLLWQELRRRGIPSHLVVGFVNVNGHLTKDTFHAAVLAMTHGAWQYYDATPPGTQSAETPEELESLFDARSPAYKAFVERMQKMKERSFSAVARTFATAKQFASEQFNTANAKLKQNVIATLPIIYSQAHNAAQSAAEKIAIDHVTTMTQSHSEPWREIYSQAAQAYIRNESTGKFIRVLSVTEHDRIDIDIDYQPQASLFDLLFRTPKELRTISKKLDRATKILDEYHDRFVSVHSLESKIGVAAYRGAAYPWKAGDPEYRRAVKELFAIAQKQEYPPDPRLTGDPKQRHYLLYNVTKQQQEWFPWEDERSYVAADNTESEYQPRDRELFAAAKLPYIPQREIDSMTHFKTFGTEKDYTLSPEVIAFDRSIAAESAADRDYKEAIWDLIRDMTESREHSYAQIAHTVREYVQKHERGEELPRVDDWQRRELRSEPYRSTPFRFM